jgi:hypothetical protein
MNFLENVESKQIESVKQADIVFRLRSETGTELSTKSPQRNYLETW